jgi:hypothetical protein
MKSILGVIVGAVVLVLVIAGDVRYQENKRAGDDNRQADLYIGVTDATADITNVNEVNLEIKGVSLHSATDGWVTVSSNNETYGLMSLKTNNVTKLHSKESVKAGTYDKVRVTLGSVTVKTKTHGDEKGYVPSDQITLTTTLKAEEGKANYLLLDFKADESLHTTTDNKYVFAPVVRVEARSNASVTVTSDETLTVTSGSVDSNNTFGVNLSGVAMPNFKLDTTGGLSVDAKVVGETKFLLNGKMYTEVRDPEEDSEGKTPADPNLDVNIENSLKVN